MKKIILLLTILLSLTLFANTQSCKLDVYFGNGVYNDSQDAEKSKDELKIFMQMHYPGRFSQADDGVTYSFKYAHNETYGVINDLIETHWQLYESGQINELYFSFVANTLNGVNNTNQNEESFRERIRNIITQYDVDVNNMLNIYRNESFNYRHNVLLIAHSQGNLFGNKMYDLFSIDEKQKFKMVSVATPASSVAGDGDYTTLHGDWVIKAIPNSLDSNADGSGHSFVESYLYNPIYKSVESLSLNINNAVNLLDENGCAVYKHFRWIGYICPSNQNQSTELEVDIYGSKVINSNGWTEEELVASDSRVFVEKVLNDDKNHVCPLTKDDYRTSIFQYDKNGCMAYTFDDTSGNIHSLDYIARKTYESTWTCTTYKMDAKVTELLKELE